MSPSVESDGLPWEATFVENAVRARKARGLSQTGLAKKLAAKGLTTFHQQTIQRIENGSRPLRLNEAIAMAEVLMLDFPEALHAGSPERATETIRNFLRTAWRDWTYMGGAVADLTAEVESQRQNLTTERSFYVRAMQGVGQEYDRDIAGEADTLLNQMWLVQLALLNVLEASFPEDMDKARKEGRL